MTVDCSNCGKKIAVRTAIKDKKTNKMYCSYTCFLEEPYKKLMITK